MSATQARQESNNNGDIECPRSGLHCSANDNGTAFIHLATSVLQPNMRTKNYDIIRAGVLDIAFERYGSFGGRTVILLHGFPYDPRCYDDVVEPLVDIGAHVIVLCLRGYGPTRFISHEVPRSGQQAALAHDLRELIKALGCTSPILAGFDWGGRAACLVAALWPDLVGGLVTVGGFNIQNIPGAAEPAPPVVERALRYQYYLQSKRGCTGLASDRRGFARLLWSEWSPTWSFNDETFDNTAESFDNPDFVDVVVHSYRHRHGLEVDDPIYAATECDIVHISSIDVPTVVLDASCDCVRPPKSFDDHQIRFTRLIDHPVLPVGHNLPQEAPGAVVAALMKLLRPHGGRLIEVAQAQDSS